MSAAARSTVWLIRGARPMFGDPPLDLRIRDGVVAQLGPRLAPLSDERIVEAAGAALLPGLHDHHLHLQALAAAAGSLHCGPPQIVDAAGLATVLRRANAAGGDWLRGIGYHDSVAGEIDRDWLDRHVPDRPVRIQHRSGRLWILNGAALERLGPPEAGATIALRRAWASGRLLDADDWLRARLPATRPALGAVSRRLAQRGVTGVTDATPGNDLAQYAHFAACQRSGELLQRLLVMGDASLAAAVPEASIAPGATKLHLHEHALPDFDVLCASIARSHAARRPIAAHCVTTTTLACVLGALAVAGSLPGDRIEHGSMIPDCWLGLLHDAAVTVVTQPNFVFERGDRYLAEIEPAAHAELYRARRLLEAGIALAAGSDAPFGDADPWRAMQAAVERRTRSGSTLGAAEALTPEQACGLFLGPLQDPARPARALVVGRPADLCLLDRDWSSARRALGDVRVRLTLRDGEALWDSACGDDIAGHRDGGGRDT